MKMAASWLASIDRTAEFAGGGHRQAVADKRIGQLEVGVGQREAERRGSLHHTVVHRRTGSG
jgi:hypothetical protein